MFLEADYRSGIKTIDALVAEYNVSRPTLNRLADKYKWERDLKPQIQARAQQMVVEENEKQAKAAERTQAIKESPTVEVAATMQKQVILASQRRVSELQTQVDGLMAELRAQSLAAQEIAHVGELVALAQGQLNETECAPAVVEKRIAAFKKMLSLSDRVSTARALGETLKTLIGLERQAYGLADNANGNADTPAGPVVQSMNDAARRVAFLLHQAMRQQQEKVINP